MADLVNQSDRQQRLEEVIGAYLTAVDGGGPVNAQEWIARHDDLNPEFAEFVNDLAQMNAVVEPIQLAGIVDRQICNRPRDGSTFANDPTITDRPLARDEASTQFVQFGDFEIIREIGRGGMGVVYEARQTSLGRLVALKMLRQDLPATDEEITRIRNEAEITAQLDHPGIVPVYDVGVHDEQFYLCMKLINGTSLAEHLNVFMADAIAAARLMLKLAQAVEHAHQRGVMHRDLKPANIILGDSKDPHITDFGLARQIESDVELTQSGAVLGTPAYMAPEQAAGKRHDVTTAVDIYGLGAIFYAVLTGRPPFNEVTVLETLDRVRSQTPSSPSKLNSRVPQELDVICNKCLEKDPSLRYRSAGMLADDLSCFLAHRPIAARPTSLRRRFRLWFQRNPALASLSTTVCVLVLVLLAGSTTAALLLTSANRETLDSLEREIKAKDKATRKEELALRALYEARVSQARSGRLSGRPGQRIESLDALEKATRLLGRLKLDESEYLRLRNLAIACMGLVDVRPDQAVPEALWRWTSVNEHADLIAYPDPEGSQIEIRSLADMSLIQKLQYSNVEQIEATLLSTDGKFLIARCDRDAPSELNVVWNTRQPEPLLKFDGYRHSRNINFLRYDFSPLGTCLAYCTSKGSIEVVELPSGRRLFNRKSDSNLFSVRFDRTGKYLALREAKRIVIIDVAKKSVDRILEYEASASTHRMAWSADGAMIAESSWDKSAHVIDSKTGALLQTLGRHIEPVVNVDFHPRGDVVVTDSWDNSTRFWSLADGRQLLRINDRSRRFSPDGKWLGHTNGRYEVYTSEVFRTGFQPRPKFASRSSPNVLAFHPGGRLLFVGNREHSVFWDLATTKPVSTTDISAHSACFSPEGSTLFTMDRYSRIWARSIHVAETHSNTLVQIGPPRRLTPAKLPHDSIRANSSFASTILRGGKTAHIINTTDSRVHQFTIDHANVNSQVDVTHDGKYLVSGTYKGDDVKIWNCATAKLVRSIPARSALAKFSPNGEVVAVAQASRISFYNVATGEMLHETAAPLNRGVIYGPINYSGDGSMVAFRDEPRHTITILAADSYNELATLELPEDQAAQKIAFSNDGGWLVATVVDDSILYFWNLRKIRKNLGTLDWNLPTLPAPTYNAAKPLIVERIDEDPIKINPPGGAYSEPIEVSIGTLFANANLYWTLDGATPTPDSPRVANPVTITTTSTLRILVCNENNAEIASTSIAFEIDPNFLPLADEHWKVWDAPNAMHGPSNWSVNDTTITQRSGIWSGDSNSHRDPAKRRDGTFRIYDRDRERADCQISFQFKTSDDDTVGIAFRFVDPENHYLFFMDRQRGFHVLARRSGGSYQVLARNGRRYDKNRWHEIRIELHGPKIAVYVDGEQDLQAVDPAIPRGSIALYTFGCEDVSFRRLKITE